eukprot:TRINITY_DN21343_c0_g1_i2.p1 TRINITY_DN21343_c0_g1~~TRINITY_DN21343_c0_g1_i2.p1  ORF type:complete len:742 (+),score=70.72 TRINITY_DN21343_c0_g1_i2:49-2226(+)
MQGTCAHLRRGKVPCGNRAVPGGEVCEHHTPEALAAARQRTAEAVPRKRRRTVVSSECSSDSVQELVGKLRGLGLPTVAKRTCTHPVAAARFHELVSGDHQQTWQASKRGWHQLQIESLVSAQLELCGIGDDTCVLELGAGKGLLGRIVSDITQRPAVMIDKRTGGVAGSTIAGATHDADEESAADPSLVRRICADVAVCDVADVARSVGCRSCLLLAKHFCGSATDLAVLTAVRHDCVQAAVLAPCCHAKIDWEDFSGREWMSERGISAVDFEVMKQSIHLCKQRCSSAADSADTDHPHAGKWATLHKLPRELLAELGFLSRVAIEWSRAERLRSAGYSPNLIEYAPQCVTPDNICIVARRGGLSAGVAPTDPWLPYGCEGLALQLNGGGACAQRVVEYLLEVRAVDGSPVRVAWSAEPAPLESASASSAALVMIQGEHSSLLPHIRADAVLQRVVDRALPFCGRVETLAAAVCSAVAQTPEDAVCRVVCYPKQSEDEATRMVRTRGVSATASTHTISVLKWQPPGCSTPCWLWSALQRGDVWDPRVWPLLSSEAPPAREVSRLTELWHRWNPMRRLLDGATVCCAAPSGGAAASRAHLLQSWVRAHGATSVITGHVASVDSAWSLTFEPERPSFTLLILDVDYGYKETVSMMQNAAASLPENTWVVTALKLGTLTRRHATRRLKSFREEVSHELKGQWESLRLVHLVSEKENERTLCAQLRQR